MKVITVKGSRSVLTTTTKDRKWMILLVVGNAIGYSIPSLYIFSRAKRREDYIACCELGAKMAMQPNGWIIEQIFVEWLDHFKDNVPNGVSENNKHLLLVDGHASQITLEVVTRASSYGIDIALLPPHTSHRF